MIDKYATIAFVEKKTLSHSYVQSPVPPIYGICERVRLAPKIVIFLVWPQLQ